MSAYLKCHIFGITTGGNKKITKQKIKIMDDIKFLPGQISE
jgi:hypothetical protein